MKKIMVSVVTLSIFLATGFAQAKPDKEKSLPPGLQKKHNRGDQLPPGWQKRLVVGEHLDDKMYHGGAVIVPVGDNGIATIQIEGRVVRLIEATREIVEILN